MSSVPVFVTRALPPIGIDELARLAPPLRWTSRSA